MRASFRARGWIARFSFLVLALAAGQATAHGQINVDAVVPCVESGTPVPICYGQHADCSIGFAADYDSFRFYGTEGDVVRISAAGTQNCVDPRIEVRDPLNVVVYAPTPCNTDCYNQCITAGAFTVATTGFHTIWINDNGNTETGNYTLHLEKLLPEYPIHSLEYAAAPYTLSIGHRGDHDFATFEGELGSQVSLFVNGASNCIDPYVEIFDPTGAPLASNPTATCTTDCYNMCNFAVHISALPLDATYTVALTDAGRTETGSVRLSLVCFYAPSGECPDATLDGVVGATYCTSNVNSTGSRGLISGYGTTSVSENRLWLLGDDLPIGQAGMFFAGQSQIAPIPMPLPSSGLLCIAPPLSRFPLSMTCEPGMAMRKLDLTSLPYSMSAIPGQTWNFQFWFRDSSTTNTTDGVAVTYTP